MGIVRTTFTLSLKAASYNLKRTVFFTHRALGTEVDIQRGDRCAGERPQILVESHKNTVLRERLRDQNPTRKFHQEQCVTVSPAVTMYGCSFLLNHAVMD